MKKSELSAFVRKFRCFLPVPLSGKELLNLRRFRTPDLEKSFFFCFFELKIG